MSTKNEPAGFGPFLPILLVCVSLLLWFSWNLNLTIQQRMNGQQLSDQLDQQLSQAAEAENKLRVMMADLVQLSETNASAKTIVTTFNISFTRGANAEPPSGATPDAAP